LGNFLQGNRPTLPTISLETAGGIAARLKSHDFSPIEMSHAAADGPERNGDHPLPSGEQAVDEPLRAFPSWFLLIVCERCGKERMVNEGHMAQGEMRIRDILDRCNGCGGRASKAELLTSIEGVSSRPVRRIVLLGDGGR
jgi:hypothetical protein